jgi:hypothetical protein
METVSVAQSAIVTLVVNVFAIDESPSNSRQSFSSTRPLPGVRARNRNVRTPPAPIRGCSSGARSAASSKGGSSTSPSARTTCQRKPVVGFSWRRRLTTSPWRSSIACPVFASVKVTTSDTPYLSVLPNASLHSANRVETDRSARARLLLPHRDTQRSQAPEAPGRSTTPRREDFRSPSVRAQVRSPGLPSSRSRQTVRPARAAPERSPRQSPGARQGITEPAPPPLHFSRTPPVT